MQWSGINKQWNFNIGVPIKITVLIIGWLEVIFGFKNDKILFDRSVEQLLVKKLKKLEMMNGDTERSKFVFGLIYNLIGFRMLYFI